MMNMSIEKSSKRAIRPATPIGSPPLAGRHSVCGHLVDDTHLHLVADGTPSAVDHPVPDPHRHGVDSATIVGLIVEHHRQRQGIIRAKTKLINQAKAMLRRHVATADELLAFGDDDSTVATRAAVDKKVTAAYAAAQDPSHPLYGLIAPYILMQEPAEVAQAALEKTLVKLAKQLPVYPWVKGVNGFGDVSFATIVGECGDVGSYKSVSAVWKRMGVAVMNGHRQGNPGTGATADDWIAEGYRKSRRSVGWNARQHVIGGMARWRPDFGEDVHANPDLTYYQRVFADRCRYEAQRLPNKDGTPIIRNPKTGRESYSLHASNRAHRYVEKRLLKHLYLKWRNMALSD